MEALASMSSHVSQPVDDTPDASPQVQAIGKRILLVGEADCSFAKAYKKLHPHDTVTATVYEKRADLKGKGTWRQLKQKMAKDNIELITKVDAKKLHKHPRLKGKAFDIIRFNFPHCGDRGGRGGVGSSTPELVDGFFRSARRMLQDEKQLVLTVVDNQQYDKVYQHQEASRSHRFQLVARKKFDPSYAANGYIHRTTDGYDYVEGRPETEFVFEKVGSDDSSFDSADYFFHSSDLSDDDGRILKPLGKRKSGRGQPDTKHATKRQKGLEERYPQESSPGRAAIQEALDLHRQQRFKEAEKLFKFATEADPQNTSYLLDRAENLRALGKEHLYQEAHQFVAEQAWKLFEKTSEEVQYHGPRPTNGLLIGAYGQIHRDLEAWLDRKFKERLGLPVTEVSVLQRRITHNYNQLRQRLNELASPNHSKYPKYRCFTILDIAAHLRDESLQEPKILEGRYPKKAITWLQEFDFINQDSSDQDSDEFSGSSDTSDYSAYRPPSFTTDSDSNYSSTNAVEDDFVDCSSAVEWSSE